MKRAILTAIILGLTGIFVHAQSYDNYRKSYVLRSVTEGRTEADRTQRMVLCDYQPSGLYVRRGEKLTISVGNLNGAYKLLSMIGFKPMWGNRNRTQENELKSGANAVTATQDGILSFIFVKREGYDTTPVTVNVSVAGGKAFPLYKFNRSNLANWQNDLRTMTDAPFVQLVSDRALVTVPYKDFMRSPLRDPSASMQTIHQVIDWEDDLAGFDNGTPENMRTNNRIHYLVDLYSTPKEQEDYYMYASDYLIGMKRDNFTDLTEKLSYEWGIWHETGHTHQQRSWTWDSIGEISVNIFSLYVQERFGLPSRLATIEGGEKKTSFEKARDYIALSNKNYLESNESDYNELFSKLAMFHQLKAVYGWDSIRKLHQYFRKQPFDPDEDVTDQDKANRFVYAMCLVTRNNLVPFFRKWGLSVDQATSARIQALKLPAPATDPARVLR